MSEKMKVVEVNSVVKKFQTDFYKKPQVALSDVTFSIEQGHFVGFIGPNGAGKSTTIKCLLEFIFPNSGQIKIFGEKQSLLQRDRIGYLPERPFFQEFLTGLEFLKLHWALGQKANVDFATRAAEILELVKLTHAKDKKLKEYSKGMLQRIGIAQALICSPDFLILDEPMSGLDPDGRILIKQILKELRQKKLTVLMSSHLLEDVEELCDDLLIIHSGKIEYTGAVSIFKESFATLEAAYAQFKLEKGQNLNA